MAEELKANQRKEWAKLMYLKENITQHDGAVEFVQLRERGADPFLPCLQEVEL